MWLRVSKGFLLCILCLLEGTTSSPAAEEQGALPPLPARESCKREHRDRFGAWCGSVGLSRTRTPVSYVPSTSFLLLCRGCQCFSLACVSASELHVPTKAVLPQQTHLWAANSEITKIVSLLEFSFKVGGLGVF